VSPRLAIASLLLVLAAPALVHAQLPGQDHDSRVLSDRGGINLGGYLVDFRTSASIGVGGVLGGYVELENQLGLPDSKNIARLDGFYRFASKHAINYGLLGVSRDGQGVLSESIEFEDVTFEAGALVTSEIDMALLRATYQYSFSNDGKLNAGLEVGLASFYFDLQAEGIGTVDNGQGGTVEEFRTVQTDLIAPVPEIGFFLQYALRPRLIVRARAAFFDLSIGDHSGRLLDTGINLDWYFNQHFGIGVGFDGVDLRYENAGENPVRIDYQFSGLLFYFSGVW